MPDSMTDDASESAAQRTPYRDFKWDTESRQLDVYEPALEVVRPYPPKVKQRSTVGSRSHLSLSNTEVCFITNGSIEALKEAHGVQELDVPSSYSAFAEEFETVFGSASITLREYAWGIDAERLEQAVRLATGGGRYSADSLTATVLDVDVFLIESADGAFLCSMKQVRDLPTDTLSATEVAPGITVQDEGDETILDGIRRFIEVYDTYFDGEITEWESRSRSSHTFATSSGDSITVYAGPLRTLAKMTETIVGTHEVSEYETEHTDGITHEFSVTDDHLPMQVGERESPVTTEQVCVGYVMEKARQNRYARNPPLKVKLGAVKASVSGGQFRVSDGKHRVVFEK